MLKQYKIFFLVVLTLACFGLIRFLMNIENIIGLQSRHPDMDFYEIHNGLYYYTSYENGFFTYNKDTNEINKLSDDKAAATSIYFQNGYVFLKTYRGSSIIRMNEDGQNRKVILEDNCYKYRVYDHKIYFIHEADRKLYKCDLEGENLTIEVDGEFSGLRIENDYLYLKGKNGQTDMKLYFESGNIERVLEN